MKKLLLPAALFATLTVALVLRAETKSVPPTGDEPEDRPPPPPIIEVLDTNHDGELSAAEIAAAPTTLLALDRNGDGILTRDELCPPPPEDDSGHPGHRPPPRHR